MDPLPLLPFRNDWEETRATLHSYARGVGSIPRALAIPQPKWWHISLKVRPTGLVTDAMAMEGGGTLRVRMDLRGHQAVVETSRGDLRSVPFDAGLSGSEFGDRLGAAVAEFVPGATFDRDGYASDESRRYDAAAAEGYFDALVNIAYNLELYRASLGGDVGPVQVWPHGFDIAFEWFGTRQITQEEDGEPTTLPSQINFGFYPAGDPYFYSNPWPFESDRLLGERLPPQAEWHTDGWEGSILPLAAAGDAGNVLEYFTAVFRAARPTLSI